MTNEYGLYETNPLPSRDFHDEDMDCMGWGMLKHLCLTENIIAERVRFVSSPGFPFWDLSYLYVRINGKRCTILSTPFIQISKRTFESDIYKILKNEKVFIKGFFNAISKFNN